MSKNKPQKSNDKNDVKKEQGGKDRMDDKDQKKNKNNKDQNKSKSRSSSDSGSKRDGKRAYSGSNGNKSDKKCGKPGKQSGGNPKDQGGAGQGGQDNNQNNHDITKSWMNKENDVAWYKKYPAIVEAQSTIIFNKIQGSEYNYIQKIMDSTNADILTPMYKAAIPGALVLEWYPFNCASGQETDALNIASKNMYTYVRHANSGSVNYESSDFFQYLLTVKQLFVQLEQLKRDLRLVLTYKANNRYAYKAVLRGFGYTVTNINDMVTNYANYVGQLAVATAQINAFKVFSDFPLLQRHLWMASNIWKDDELDKATYFAYYTRAYYHYDWANSELKTQDIQAHGTAFTDRLSAIVNEINTLLGIEDVGIMLGDILKAYKDEDCFISRALLMGETQEAEFDAEMANQVRNAVIVCGGGTWGYEVPTVSVKQVSSNSQLLYEQCGSGYYNGPLMEPGKFYFINNIFKTNATHIDEFLPPLVADSDSPDSDTVLVNTRLTYAMKAAGFTTTTGPSQAFGVVESCGTEILVNASVIVYNSHNTGGGFLSQLPFKTLDIIDGSSAIEIAWAPDFEAFALSREISFAPSEFMLIRLGTSNQTPTVALMRHVHGKNVIRLDKEWLKNLHDACRLSEFTIPMFKLLTTNS